jgi:two-component system, OmpR family, phosphate regulon sensor histidine kinase PhoR
LHSIRWRTVISFTLLILVCIVGISSYFYHFFNGSYIQSLESQTAEQAVMISSASEPYFAGNTTGDIDAFVKTISQDIGNRITIIGADGTVLGDSVEDPAVMENHANRPEVAAALSGKTSSTIRYSSTLGYDMLYTAVPIHAGSEIVGCSRVAIPLTIINSHMHHILITIIWVSFLAALTAFVLALQLSKLTTVPVRKLTQMARKISEGDLNQEIKTASRGEIGELATAFNLMATKIKEIIWLLGLDRDRMSAILSQMSDGIVLIDAEGKISLINNAAKNIFMIKEEKSIGSAFIEAVHDYELNELLSRCMKAKTECTGSVEVVETKQFLLAIATPLEGGGCLLLLQNLTELKRLDAIKRDLSANISHELRLPIASIKALSETLSEGAINDSSVAKEFVGQINAEADRLAQMVQELGDLSQIESGQAPLAKQKTDIGEFIHRAVERLSPQADRAGLSIKIDIASELPPVAADRGRIEQVLVNLLHNSMKFTPSGGSITISATPAGDSVQVSIRDTGVGISADDLPRIFERFYKADRARSGGGTGLGLAIVKHIIEAHGGKVWAQSVEGKGATFTFTLPYK